jgi:hypothetical protein
MVLDGIHGEMFVVPSDGPFSLERNAGTWVELRDEADRTLYTQSQYQLIADSKEVPPPPGPDGRFSNITTCPEHGLIRVQGFPNEPRAVHLVLFQKPVDGRRTKTVELARFRLPRPAPVVD